MVELAKLITDKHGGLLILLAVMLIAIYGSHTFSGDERAKAMIMIDDNSKAIHVNSERLHELDKDLSVHIAGGKE